MAKFLNPGRDFVHHRFLVSDIYKKKNLEEAVIGVE